MAITADQLVGDVAALRAAVVQLLKVAQSASIGGGFAKTALEVGLAQLDDVSRWAPPPQDVDRVRADAKQAYRDLFNDL